MRLEIRSLTGRGSGRVASLMRSMLVLVLPALMSLPAHAQVSSKSWRIGIALPGFSDAAIASRSVPVQPPFEEGLRELGWIEGRNVEYFYRGGARDKDGNQAAAAIDDLLRLSVDVIVTFSDDPTLQAMRATSTVPIVARMDQGIRSGMVKSLARPGGNVTGISNENMGSLATKRLAMLKETAPMKRVARIYLGEPLRFGSEKDLLPEYGIAARALGLEIFPVWAANPEELRTAFAELTRRGATGLSVGPISRIPGIEATWDALLELVQRYRIPAMYDLPRAADQGGLMSYGVDYTVQARRLAYFVDRVLKGARPADIPVEQPSSGSLVINLKAAKAIGIKVPASVLLQADRVIQ